MWQLCSILSGQCYRDKKVITIKNRTNFSPYFFIYNAVKIKNIFIRKIVLFYAKF